MIDKDAIDAQEPTKHVPFDMQDEDDDSPAIATTSKEPSPFNAYPLGPEIDASISPDMRPDNQGHYQWNPDPQPNAYGVKMILDEFFKYTPASGGWMLYECCCERGFWKRNQSPANVRNCGCKVGPGRMDLMGETFHKLKVVGYQRGAGWKCECSCGKIRWANTTQLMNGLVKHCGDKACKGYRPAKEPAQLSARMLQDARQIKLGTGESIIDVIEALFYEGLKNRPDYQKHLSVQIVVDSESIEE